MPRPTTTDPQPPVRDVARAADPPARGASAVERSPRGRRAEGRAEGRTRADGGAAAPSRSVSAAARLLTMVHALAALLAGAGWLVGRGREGRVSTVELAFGLVNLPYSYTLVSAVLLGLETWALIGRKRVGLVAVAAFQVLGILLGVAAAARLAGTPGSADWPAHRMLQHELDVASIGIGLVVLVGLWRLRGVFTAHTPPGSWRRLVLTLVGGAAVTTATAVVLVGATTEQPHRGRLVVGVLARSVGAIGRRHAEQLAPVPVWVPEICSALLAATLLAAVVLFLRAGRRARRWSGQRELATRALVERYGEDDSLAYFATRRDKEVVFSPDRRAMVAYGVRHGVSLAAGDPVGDRASWPAAIQAWRTEARHYGWLPAVLSASEDGARAYVAAGLRPLAMGDEAVLEPSRFSLAAPALGPVRHAAQRASRAGLRTEVRRQEQVPPAELAELVAAAASWRQGVDRGFSMALDRVADPADGQVLWVTARDADGALQGLLSFVPWGRRGVSLDLMRRSPTAPNGVTELLVTDLLRGAARLGLVRVSLNFCVLRPVYAAGRRFGAGTVTRLNYSLLGVLDRFWQLERLYRANQKYDPSWRPRFLCYEDLVALPQVLVAAASAEGFLPTLPGSPAGAGAGAATLSPAELDALAAQRARAEEERGEAALRRGPQQERAAHLAGLAAAGRPPYPVGAAAPSTTVAALARQLAGGAAEGSAGTGPVRVAGRPERLRDHGAVVFVRLGDGGAAVQVVLEADRLGTAALQEFRRLVDTGDLVEVAGVPGTSRNGTPSLLATGWTMLAKALHPVPYGGLTDPGARLRRRSTDLLVHPEVLGPLRARATVLDSLRSTLRDQGYLEVETPILHSVHGGATARPFTTVSNAYGVGLSLRIAPELYLKRLLVGGTGPIFEIGRNFRNEGADATHNPEFTALEAYRPYADYTTMRVLTEQLVTEAARAVHGRPALRLRPVAGGEPTLVDVSAPWPVVPVMTAVSAAVQTTVDEHTDVEELLALARRHGVAVHPAMTAGAVVEELYADLVEARTVLPTFYTDFPQESSPLTAPHRTRPGLVERWDLVANGMELGTAYSELTDPVEQRRRLTEQSLLAAGGDPEAMELDEDFLYALETGMPPTGGLGLGVDRLLVLLTADSIRDVLTFPFVRPEGERRGGSAG